MAISDRPDLRGDPNARSGPAGETALWERLRLCMEAETGMDFGGARLTRLQEAVGKVLARRTPAASLERLLASPREHGPLLEHLAAELTVGETFFFRNEHHFRALREQVFPEILRRNAGLREIRVWSAGCASGEEPYSVAILLDQMLRGSLPSGRDGTGTGGPDSRPPRSASAGDWHVAVLATDLNPQFLHRGREALYRPWSFRQTDIHHDRRYFIPEADGFRLAARVRGWVRFAYLNLVKDVYPSPLTGTLGLDLILFRNVAIYLKSEVTSAILARFCQALRPGGWLLLGETEVSLAPTAGLEVRRFEQATFYQKVGESPLAASTGQWSPPSPVVSAPRVRPVAAAPPLPSWGQLPTKSGTGLAPTAGRRGAVEGSPWERIERCLATRSFDEAERTLERVAAVQDRARWRMRYAQGLLECAEIARARRMLDLCLKEQPLLVEAQLLQASFAEEDHDLEAAERAYRRALFIDRTCPMAHFHLGLVLDQKGDRAGAARSFRTTLKLSEGKDPQSLVDYGEGMCYGRLREMVNLLVVDVGP